MFLNNGDKRAMHLVSIDSPLRANFEFIINVCAVHDHFKGKSNLCLPTGHAFDYGNAILQLPAKQLKIVNRSKTGGLTLSQFQENDATLQNIFSSKSAYKSG